MSDKDEEGKVVSLFGGSNLVDVELEDKDITGSELLDIAAEAGFEEMLILGITGDEMGFVTNIKTIPELVYLMERIKHYFVTIGMEE